MASKAPAVGGAPAAIGEPAADEARPHLERRTFLGACAGAAAVAVAATETRASVVQPHPPAQLVDASGQPVRAADVPVGACLVFTYPYVATPCFLIRLGAPATPVSGLDTEAGQGYVWPGGSGPDSSLVAFSAICSHKLSHPAKAISFINYRHEPVRFRSANRKEVVGENLIYCCSDKSVFDPARGAQVLGGPAKQPLATVLVEHDSASDTLRAIGILGGDKFDEFIERFGHRIALERGISDVRASVGERSTAVPIAEFSRRQMRCGAV